MNLQDLGNLGEFVGAIAVLVTLVYLALNIRQNTAQLSQNTRAVQLTARQATEESTNRVREMLILNPELSDLYLRGLRGYSELDKAIFGMVNESPGRNASEPIGGPDTNFPGGRAFSVLAKATRIDES